MKENCPCETVHESQNPSRWSAVSTEWQMVHTIWESTVSLFSPPLLTYIQELQWSEAFPRLTSRAQYPSISLGLFSFTSTTSRIANSYVLTGFFASLADSLELARFTKMKEECCQMLHENSIKDAATKFVPYMRAQVVFSLDCVKVASQDQNCLILNGLMSRFVSHSVPILNFWMGR